MAKARTGSAERERGHAERVERHEAEHEAAQPDGQQHSQRAGGDGHEEALGEQLGAQAPARRAEGRANGHLRLARGAARQQQAGHVGARDQQQHANRRHEDEEVRAVTLGQRLLERRQQQRLVPVAVRIVLLQLGADPVDLPLRGTERDARLQPAKQHPVVKPPHVRPLRVPLHRDPDVDIVGEPEAGRHHPDDRDRAGRGADAEGQRAADDVSRRSQRALPVAVADDGHRGSAALALGRVELAPDGRVHTERLEQVPRDLGDEHRLRTVALPNRHAPGLGQVG